MRKTTSILSIIMLLIVTGCSNKEVIEHNDTYKGENQHITRIEQLKYTDREKLLQKSEGIDHSYIFKINNLEPMSTYQFECWSEHYKNGQLNNKIELLEQPQAFVVGDKSSNGYIILSLKGYSLQCTLSRENYDNSIIVSGHKEESFKYEGEITDLREVNISENNEILLLASAKGKNGLPDIETNQNKKLVEDAIKKNDEVYLIKCKLIKSY